MFVEIDLIPIQVIEKFILLQASTGTTNPLKPTQPLPGVLNQPTLAMTIDWGAMQFEQ
jgi:hypothetical protein